MLRDLMPTLARAVVTMCADWILNFGHDRKKLEATKIRTCVCWTKNRVQSARPCGQDHVIKARESHSFSREAPESRMLHYSGGVCLVRLLAESASEFCNIITEGNSTLSSFRQVQSS